MGPEGESGAGGCADVFVWMLRGQMWLQTACCSPAGTWAGSAQVPCRAGQSCCELSCLVKAEVVPWLCQQLCCCSTIVLVHSKQCCRAYWECSWLGSSVPVLPALWHVHELVHACVCVLHGHSAACSGASQLWEVADCRGSVWQHVQHMPSM